MQYKRKRAEMQPTSRLELNIGLDAKKNACRLSALFEVFLLRNDYHYQADYLI